MTIHRRDFLKLIGASAAASVVAIPSGVVIEDFIDIVGKDIFTEKLSIVYQAEAFLLKNGERIPVVTRLNILEDQLDHHYGKGAWTIQQIKEDFKPHVINHMKNFNG